MTTVRMSELYSDCDAERSRRGIGHGSGGRSLIHADGNDHVRDIFGPHAEQVLLMLPVSRSVHHSVGTLSVLVVGSEEISAARRRVDIEIELAHRQRNSVVDVDGNRR